MPQPFPYSNLPYSVAASALKGEWQPTPPEEAELCWREGVPYSPRFNDFYFSKVNGLDETRYVFHESIDLASRFAAAEQTCIAELGFGTGLSFLASKQLFYASAPQHARLHFISFERYPLAPGDLEAVHACFPDLRHCGQSLLAGYPPRVAGVHRLHFDEGRVVLDLVLGEVKEFLPLLLAEVDVWFLDGFAPARNNGMWTREIFEQLARCSRAGAKLATFSAARSVRDNLEAVGFQITRRKGYGKKREMLCAQWRPEEAAPVRQQPLSSVANSGVCVAVIGAGLAGATLAWTLARRGLKVDVYEEHGAVAQEASGNAAGVLMPYLSVRPDFLSRFYVTAFLHTRRMLKHYFAKQEVFSECGVLRLASSARLEKLLGTLAEQQLPEQFARVVDEAEASTLCGLKVKDKAIWHENAGVVNPARWVRALLVHPSISLHCESRICQLKARGAGWQLTSENTRSEYDAVFLANAYRLGAFEQSRWIPLEPVKGQLCHLGVQQSLNVLKSVLCYDGYLLPLLDKTGFLLGASYEHDAEDLNTSAEVNTDLLQRLFKRVTQLESEPLEIVHERAAYRSMSPDRMPILGMVPDINSFQQAYLEVNDNNFGDRYPMLGRHENLFISSGHGSRGIASSLFSAEILTAMLLGETIPLEADLLRASDPARFLVRMIKRGHSLV